MFHCYQSYTLGKGNNFTFLTIKSGYHYDFNLGKVDGVSESRDCENMCEVIVQHGPATD